MLSGINMGLNGRDIDISVYLLHQKLHDFTKL